MNIDKIFRIKLENIFIENNNILLIYNEWHYIRLRHYNHNFATGLQKSVSNFFISLRGMNGMPRRA